MGDVAASGGYYIVTPAHKIFADPNTITGSIGVFGVLPNIKGFLNEKIGITTDVVKTNDHADLGTILRPLEPEEMTRLQSEIGNFYDTFITKVAEGRGMTKEEVDKIARGHVYSGIDAKEIGLLDEFGGMTEAIAAAAEAAELDNYRIVKYPEYQAPFLKFLEDISGEAKLRILKKELGDNYFYYQQLEEVKNMKGVQARIPYIMDVN
jgi:protease-4